MSERHRRTFSAQLSPLPSNKQKAGLREDTEKVQDWASRGQWKSSRLGFGRTKKKFKIGLREDKEKV